jgi:hypothetical protein
LFLSIAQAIATIKVKIPAKDIVKAIVKGPVRSMILQGGHCPRIQTHTKQEIKALNTKISTRNKDTLKLSISTDVGIAHPTF